MLTSAPVMDILSVPGSHPYAIKTQRKARNAPRIRSNESEPLCQRVSCCLHGVDYKGVAGWLFVFVCIILTFRLREISISYSLHGPGNLNYLFYF